MDIVNAIMTNRMKGIKFMNKYQKLVEIIESGNDKILVLYNAIKKVVERNEDLDATDKFSEAVSKEVGFEFKAKDYGIKKIHGIVNKHKNKSFAIIHEISDLVENTIIGDIFKQGKELNVNPLVWNIIYKYNFGSYDVKYEEYEYDGLKDIINKGMDEAFIIDYCLKIMNISETRDLKDMVKYFIENMERDEELFDEDDLDYDDEFDDEEE